MRKKKGHRALYGLLGAIMAATAIGSVAAKEKKPYDAPELRLVRGTEEYDLTEGITYNKNKYELMVEDTGDFDIEVLGKYTVEYSLTPKEDQAITNTGIGGTSSPGHASGGGTSGGGGSSNAGSGNSNAEKDENTEIDPDFSVKDDVDSSAGNTGLDQDASEDKKENSSSDSTGTPEEDNKSENNAEDQGTSGNGSAGDKSDNSSSEDRSDEEDSDHGNGSDNKDSDSSDDNSENSGNDAGSSDGNPGENSDSDQENTDSENSDNSAGDSDSAGVSARSVDYQIQGSFISRMAARLTGRVYAAEIEPEKESDSKKEKTSKAAETEKETSESAKTETEEKKETEVKDPENLLPQETENINTNETMDLDSAKSQEAEKEGTLDEDDGIIYFERTVRVVASENESSIEYDDPHLKIPANAELFGVQLYNEAQLATDSNATSDREEKATDSNAKKNYSEKETEEIDEGFWVNETEDDSDDLFWDSENESEQDPLDDSDGITEDGIEYKLVLKKPELLLEDAFFTNAEGEKVKKVKITVKNDEDLKTAVVVDSNEKGIPVIAGMELGSYTVELSAVDPETKEEIVCEREVEIVASEQVKFHAPVLYIGTKNTNYDLTANVAAVDEFANEVAPIYVIDETELLDAKEEIQVKATPSNATPASETEEYVTEVRLKKGVYHVTLGAKHPVTGDEFTVKREVNVVDGYYIYAPDLEVEAGSTTYNLLDGVEVRNAEDNTPVQNIEVTVEDISQLSSNNTSDTENENDHESQKTDVTNENDEMPSDDDVAEYSSYEMEAIEKGIDSHGLSIEESAENVAAETTSEMPALKEGKYQVTLAAVDQDGQKITVVRSVQARAANAFYIFSSASGKSDNNQLQYIGSMPAPSIEDHWHGINEGAKAYICYRSPYDSISLAAYTGAINKECVNVNYYTGSSSYSHYDWGGIGRGDWHGGMGRGNINYYNWDTTDNDIKAWTTDATAKVRNGGTELYWDRIATNNLPENNYTSLKYDSKDLADFIYNYGGGYSLTVDLNGGILDMFGKGGTDSYNQGKFTIKNNLTYRIMNGFIGTKEKPGGTNWNDDGSMPWTVESGATLRMENFRYTDAKQKTGKIMVVNGSGNFIYIASGGANNPLMNLFNHGSVSISVNNNSGMMRPIRISSSNQYVKLSPNGSDILLSSLNDDYGTDGDTLTKDVIIASDGTIIMWHDKHIHTPNSQNRLRAKNLILKSSVMIGKSPITNTNKGGIYIWDGLESNGYKIRGTDYIGLSGKDGTVAWLGSINYMQSLVEGEYYAQLADRSSKTLDPTDFELRNQNRAVGYGNLYFSNPLNNGKVIYVKKLTTKPIQVISPDGQSTYFETYKDAIESISTSASGTYTIKNLIEHDFDDDNALTQFSNTNVNLVFESGERASNDTNPIGGKYYHVRMRRQLIELPADVNVTFKNIVLKHAQGSQKQLSDENMVFINNGGKLTFGENVKFLAGDNNAIGYATVYGGSDGSACTKDTVIDIQSGTFKAVYGGSRGTSGTHSGAAKITIGGTATVSETVSGSSENETAKTKDNDDAGTEKQSEITITNALSVKNIYNYDKLTVTGSPVTVSQTFNSEDATGYTGATILGGGSSLILSASGSTNIRQMGSLKLADDATANAALKFAKTAGTSSDKTNQNLVVFTKPDPLASAHTNLRIEVGYSDTTPNPEPEDIVLYLKGVPDEDAAKETQVSTEHLEDQFVNANGEHKDSQNRDIAMRANPAEKTIILVNASVGLTIDPATTPTPYITLEEALSALTVAEKATSGGTYRINFFGDNYSFSEKDKAAMESARALNPKQVTWTSKIDASGAELAKAKVVFPAGDLIFFGENTIVKDMSLSFTGQRSIYADGKPLTISTGVDVSVGTTPDLYGGGKTEKANTDLKVYSGTFRKIYGGGDGANVTGNTSVVMSGATADSVYGGSKGGTVGGSSTVNMEIPNKAETTEFTFTDISGEGTTADGTLTASVTGTKTVRVVPQNNGIDLKVHAAKLTGFDKLTLGDATGTIDYADQQFRITDRFDSRVADSTANDRTDTVNLNRSALVLECGSGHIGSLNSTKVSAFVIKRENDTTYPLFVDGKVSVSSTTAKAAVYDKIRLMYVDQQDSKENDVMVTYTKTANTTDTEAIFYEDGTNGGLPTIKMDRNGGTSDIIFSMKKAHTVEGEVLYPDDSRVENAADASENISKYIVVKYDPANEHAVAGGYVIKVPKDKITDKTYTENYMQQDGSYSAALGKGLTEGSDIFGITFDTTGQTGNGAKGTTNVPVPIDTDAFYYVAHVMCTNGDACSVLIDVTAPKQSNTSGDATIDYEGNGATGTYVLRGDFRDFNITDKNTLPDAPSTFQSLGTKLSYVPHGIKQVAWSFGDVNGNETAEKAAAKSEFVEDSETNPTGLHLITGEATNEAVLNVEFSIPQEDVDKAVANGQEYVVLYLKDRVNNTAKYMIPLSDSMIDVKVPTRVSLVAIKKSGVNLTVADCKLLAPTCYIENYGNNQLKAEVSKFEADTTNALLQLIQGTDSTTYSPNQIALHLKKTGSGLSSNEDGTDADTRFHLRDVLSIQDQDGKRAYLGDLKSKADDGHLLDFTFGAYYDPMNINETEEWLTNTMSYHFSLIKTINQQPNP